MSRIYYPGKFHAGDTISLPEVAYRHLIQVLRKTVGESFILVSGDNLEWPATIRSCDKKKLMVSLGEAHLVNRESPFAIHLAHALCKGDKFDLIIQKSVELGVAEVTPLISSRSAFGSLEKNRMDKKLNHWHGVMVSAIEQCGRNSLPKLHTFCELETFLEQPFEGLKCILTPNTAYSLSHLSKEKQKAIVLIGPEGGWSEAELHLAKAKGYTPITLGPRVLRTETASLVSLSILQAMFGDFR